MVTATTTTDRARRADREATATARSARPLETAGPGRLTPRTTVRDARSASIDWAIHHGGPDDTLERRATGSAPAGPRPPHAGPAAGRGWAARSRPAPPAGDVVLELHSRGGWVARAALDRLRRAFAIETTALTRLVAEIVLRPPDLRHLDAAVSAISSDTQALEGGLRPPARRALRVALRVVRRVGRRRRVHLGRRCAATRSRQGLPLRPLPLGRAPDRRRYRRRLPRALDRPDGGP